MQRRRIRSNDRSGSLASALAVGLGLGLAAGFLLGERYAGHPPAALARLWGRRARRPEPGRPADLALALQERLEQALGPDGQSIELIPIGHQAVEVQGWVTSRMARSRALRIARAALGPDVRLVDGLLVWGEDDAHTREQPAPTEPPRERDSA